MKGGRFKVFIGISAEETLVRRISLQYGEARLQTFWKRDLNWNQS